MTLEEEVITKTLKRQARASKFISNVDTVPKLWNIILPFEYIQTSTKVDAKGVASCITLIKSFIQQSWTMG